MVIVLTNTFWMVDFTSLLNLSFVTERGLDSPKYGLSSIFLLTVMKEKHLSGIFHFSDLEICPI